MVATATSRAVAIRLRVTSKSSFLRCDFIAPPDGYTRPESEVKKT